MTIVTSHLFNWMGEGCDCSSTVWFTWRSYLDVIYSSVFDSLLYTSVQFGFRSPDGLRLYTQRLDYVTAIIETAATLICSLETRVMRPRYRPMANYMVLSTIAVSPADQWQCVAIPKLPTSTNWTKLHSIFWMKFGQVCFERWDKL